MASHEWFTLHVKGVTHISKCSGQIPAVRVDQMPNRLLLAANQSCHASIG